MNEHESIRELLALAAAGALDESEQRTLDRHLASCPACSAELDAWRGLAVSLKRLPTPQAPPMLVERTRSRVALELAAVAERRKSHWVMAFLVLFSWTVTLVTWPVVRLLSGGILSWFDLSFSQTWFGLAGYTALGWLTAGVAGAVLGLRRRRERRFA
jgi:anti-sigma factor RsiW